MTLPIAVVIRAGIVWRLPFRDEGWCLSISLPLLCRRSFRTARFFQFLRVIVQRRVEFGETELPVYFRAVERLSVLAEYHALFFAGITFEFVELQSKSATNHLPVSYGCRANIGGAKRCAKETFLPKPCAIDEWRTAPQKQIPLTEYNGRCQDFEDEPNDKM